VTLCQVAIHTGRTHQIRVHLKSIGHVVLGDKTYGWRLDVRLPKPPRVMLHAARLGFTHPITQEPIELEAPLPVDFEAMLAALRSADQR
jgi:23S rRNA pseudouridine1911/1915/1917 synthase